MSVRSHGLLAVLGFTALATPAHAALSTWSLRVPVQLQSWNDTTNDFDVVSNVSTTNTAIPDGLTVVGNGASSSGSSLVYSITGAQYAALNPGTANATNDRGLRLIGIEDAVLNQTYDNTTHRIQTNFATEFKFAGAGTLSLFNVESSYGLLDASDQLLQLVGSSGGTASYLAGDNTASFQYVDNFGGPDANLGTHVVGDFVIGFEWTGYAPTDVLEISMPNPGVTVQQTPEPAAFAVLVPAVLFLNRRRRNVA